MKEYTVTFDGFNKGLRPTEDVPKNTQSLIRATNAKVVEGGMASVTEPVPIPGVAAIWPLPQLFKTSAGIIIAVEDALYRLNDNNTVTLLHTGFLPGTYWDLVDYMDFIIATNRIRTIIYNPVTDTWQTYATGVAIPQVGTMCDFNGQLVMGDLPATWSLGAAENWVAWTRIGALDARPGTENVAGASPMRWNGPVHKVMKLGQHVMAYGSHGIAALMPASSPAVTFGTPQRNLFDFGIASRRAVTGDSSEHYFVDTSGHLWHITDNHSITKLGYREFFAPMIGTEIVMSLDPIRREVRICNHETGYILTKHGLGGPLDIVISDTIYDDYRHGLVVGVPDEWTYEECEFTIETQDFGVREIKNTGWISVTQRGAAKSEVKVHYKHNKENPLYNETPYIETNEENAAFVRQAGTDIRISAKLSEFDEVTMSKLAYAVQVPDRRFTRGARGGRGEKAE